MNLSSTQRRIWFAEQLGGVGSAYILPFALRLRGQLRIDLLEDALCRCVAQHPALRTMFTRQPDGDVVQHVLPHAPLPPLCAHQAANQRDAFSEASKHVRLPMELAEAPLLRPKLLRVAADDHLLALPLHHLVGDGYSLALLHRQLVANYGSEPPSGPQSSYLDFVMRENDSRAAEHLAAVKEALRDTPEMHSPVPDKPRPQPRSFRGHDVRTRISSTWIRRLAESHHVSPFVAYSALLHALLVRHTGQQDSVIGFMSANRLAPGSRSVIGPFANPLPQRVECSGDPTVSELIGRARQALFDAAACNELRLDDLVAELGLARSADRHPLFQVMLNEVALGGPLIAADGLAVAPLLLDGGTSWLDLELSLLPRGDGTTELHLKAGTDLYNRDTAQRFLRQLVSVIRAAGDDPRMRLSEIPLLNRRERAAVVTAGTGQNIPEATNNTLHDLVYRGLMSATDSTALISADEQLTYPNLVARVTSMANFLRCNGIRQDTVVAVSAPRSVELVVALLGTILAGGAYLPLDPELPAVRRAAMLAEVAPSVVLTLEDIRAVALEPVALAEFADCAPTPEATAYVLYTSGSTGRPKAVVITQRGIHNRLVWMRDRFQIDAQDRLLQKTPVTFDVSVWELFLPFAVGATLVLPRPDGHRDAPYLGELLTTHAISIVHFVPSMLMAFLETHDRIGGPHLRHVICSGESLPSQVADRALAAIDGQLHNLYGPTEAAIDVTVHDCTRGASTVPIGRPVPNTRVHVLDERREPVPFGMLGELYIGGVQLARGYHQQPELTAKQFVTGLGHRLYRTGDLGRMRPDGTIEFVGRRDRQVKLRGVRVELAEVEYALEQIPEIRRALCRVADSQLIAYLLAEQIGERSLRSAAAELLPSHMIPTRFLTLTDIPLLSNGKVDERRLAASAHAVKEPVRSCQLTEREAILIPLVEQVVRRTGLDPGSSFYSVGGDSMRAVQLVAAAAGAGLALTVEDVLRHPVMSDLAAVAGRSTNRQVEQFDAFFAIDDVERAGLTPDVVDALPLSAMLASLIVESQRAGYRVYVTSVRLQGRLQVNALGRAVVAVLRRHPILRSSFKLVDGARPLHLVHDDVELIPEVYLEASDSELDAWLTEQECSPFDWACPPLLRIAAHRLSSDEFQLSIAEPFLDGWSATTVIVELITLLRGKSLNGLVDNVYREFIHGELAAIDNPGTRQFWKSRLQECTATRLPFPIEEGEQVRLDIQLPGVVSQQLLSTAESSGVPLKSMLLAAHVRVLSLLTGQRSITTGLMANARPETSTAIEAVGLFLNTTLLGVDLPGGSWRELIHAMHDAEAVTLPHRAFPYAHALRVADIDQPTDATFNYTYFHRYHDVSASGLRANDQTYFPLTAQFRREPITGSVELTLELRSTDELWARRCVELYQLVLADLAKNVDRRYDVDFVARNTKLFGQPAQLLRPSVASDDPYALFEEQVQRQPQGVALVVGGRETTYTGLADMVTSVRAYLVNRGVSRGHSVGVHLPRSEEQVAAMLAVLSLEAVYTPLDASLSPHRLSELAKSAGCITVLGADLTFPAVQHPEGVGFLIFTSGSTGAPKGVLISRTSVANRITWGWREFPYRDGEIVAARTPIGFVDSLVEVLSPLLRGVTVALVDESETAPDDLVAALSAVGATRVTMVPTMLAEVLRLNVDLLATVPRLRTWVLSGEPLLTNVAHGLLARMPHAEVHNIYGCTEVTADVSAYRVTGEEQCLNAPIGAPIDGCVLAVVDPWGHPVIQGVSGELMVSGAAVAVGYINQPFDDSPYRTGDLGWFDEDGVLHHLGRIDRQIKVRGVRIDPTAVERALCLDPCVVDAVVDHELRAYLLIGEQGEAPLTRRLREFVRHSVSRSAVPSRFAVVDSWPLTSTGKIDMRALPATARWLDVASPDHGEPETLMEQTIAELWRTRLRGATTVCRTDDFFDLGGQSLTAVVLASDLRRRLDVPVSVEDIFDYPVLSELAARLDQCLIESATAEEIERSQ